MTACSWAAPSPSRSPTTTRPVVIPTRTCNEVAGPAARCGRSRREPSSRRESRGFLRNEIAKEGEKALGIKLNIETINANDIQARITSAIQSGSGPDVVCVLNNWEQLYGESAIDVSDIAEVLGKGQGGFYETSRAVANDGKKWIAVPWCIVGLQIAYRKSWFAEIGYTDGKFPQTWEEYREAGKKLKAKGNELSEPSYPSPLAP
jgi:ABC-type glycerol-3-phosphate transport system substrate-binding protein